MNRITCLLLLLIFLVQVNHAGTVILTGTCDSTLASGNAINFSLVNKGNDSAYSLMLSPIVFGAKPDNNTYSISSLSPNQNVTTMVHLVNITGKGSFVDAFILDYQQGQQTFTALFPCLVNIGNATSSELHIYASSQVNSSNVARVSVNVTNAGNNQISVNVSALVPPTFGKHSNTSYIITLDPFQTKNLIFVYSLPPGQVSYSAAITANYLFKGLNHASLATITVSNYISRSNANTQYYLIIGTVAVVLLLALLVLRSFIRGKKNNTQTATQ